MFVRNSLFALYVDDFVTMFARLLSCGVYRTAGVASSDFLKLGLTHSWAQSRSFGVFSSIRENQTDKMEQKKQKEMGSFGKVCRF